MPVKRDRLIHFQVNVPIIHIILEYPSVNMLYWLVRVFLLEGRTGTDRHVISDLYCSSVVQRWPCYITYPVLALQDVGHPDGGPLQKVCDRLEVPVPRRHDVLLHRHQVDQRPPGVVLVCYSVVS